MVANDAKHIGKFMADEWVIVSQSGLSTKREFLRAVASKQVTHSSMKRVGRSRVRTYGESAVFTARVTNSGRFEGQRFKADEWTTDVFVRREGRWTCVLSHITSVQPAEDSH